MLSQTLWEQKLLRKLILTTTMIASANKGTIQPTAREKLNATLVTDVVLERRPSPSMEMLFIPTELQGKKRVRLSLSQSLAKKRLPHHKVLSEV